MKTTTLFLVAVSAVSAGVHAGLAPEHLHEWLPLGVAFVVAAVGVSAGAVAITVWPRSVWSPRLLGAVLGAVAAAYALTRTAALPPLDPTREPLDVLGFCTSALEVAGLFTALHLTGGTAWQSTRTSVAGRRSPSPPPSPR